MPEKEIPVFYPKSTADWRSWLEKNHLSVQAVWLIMYKKNAGIPTISWDEAVDQALCFGWIDSRRKTIDDRHFIQFFTRRKPKGTWSKVNKEKVEKLSAAGLMTEAGWEVIEKAKQNGSWTILDSIEALELPKDFEKALREKAEAYAYYIGLSKSLKKMILYWIVSAKRPETREKRISEIVEQVAKKQKPKPL